MPDPSTLRDSTQIVLPSNALEGIREDLIEEFTLTLYEMDVVIRDGSGTPAKDGDEAASGDEDPGEMTPASRDDEDPDGTATEDYVRIIGSPVEIKAASDFLSRRGVRLR